MGCNFEESEEESEVVGGQICRSMVVLSGQDKLGHQEYTMDDVASGKS